MLLKKWERFTAIPLTLLGIGFIFAYSVLILVPDAPRALTNALAAEALLTWLAFAIDYFVRLALAPIGSKGKFVAHNIPELLSIIIPLFRAFRVLRLLHEIPYFKSRSGAAIRTQVISYAVGYALIFVYFIALATLEAERHAEGATITTFPDAIWWAVVTLATVGYGDVYPVTGAGRGYAILLMVGGIAIVGTASATVISFITEMIKIPTATPPTAGEKDPVRSDSQREGDADTERRVSD